MKYVDIDRLSENREKRRGREKKKEGKLERK